MKDEKKNITSTLPYNALKHWVIILRIEKLMNIQDRIMKYKKKIIKSTKDIIFTIQNSCLLDSYSN